MFDSIINRAQHSVESAMLRYVMRLAVAVPFVVAFFFAVAAASGKLTEIYGYVMGHAILAAAFAVVGLVAAVVISVMQPSASITANYNAEAQTATSDAANTPASSFLDSDLLVATLGIVGPKMIPAIPALMRFVVKNWSLVLSVVMVTYLLYSESSRTSQQVRQSDVSA